MSMSDEGFDFEDVGGGVGESSSYVMTVGVIRVKKKDYAVGLQWNSLQDTSKAEAEARKYASEPSVSAQVIGVRQSLNPQFAVGFKSYGHKPGMPSLAAHAAKEKGGSWLGLFEVPGGFYLLAIRDDAIISEFDRFYDDQSAAIRAFDELRYMNWDDIIAPASIDLQQKHTTTLEELLVGKPPVRLQDVHKTSPIIELSILGFLVIGGFIGISTYLDAQKQAELAEQARVLAEQARSTVSQQPQEPPPPPMPWEGMPQGAKFLEKCVAEIRGFQLKIPGWDAKDFFCSSASGTAAVALDRKGEPGAGASITWIKKYVWHDGFKPAIVPPPEGSGNRVKVEWQLEGVPSHAVDIKTAKIGKIREALLMVFESRMTGVKFSDADSNTFWRGLAFNYETKIDPLAFNDVLAAVPGLIVDDVQYSLESKTWNVKGRAYEQLPLPKKKIQ